MTTTSIPLKIKAWRLQGYGLENLTLDTIDTPELKSHEVLVKVGAVSLNYRDKGTMDHELGEVIFPLIPVADAAGTIVKTGMEVKDFKIGDRVMSHLWSHWLEGEAAPDGYKYLLGSALQGGLAEYMVLEAQSIIRTPDFFTDEEACCFPTAGLSPWYALVDYGNLKPGETILVQGSGGVSVFGIQIAKLLGAQVIATTSSEQKAAKLRAIGATEVINYVTNPDWVREVLLLTQGKGVDHLLEVVGGTGLNDSIKAVKYNGQISMIGFLHSQNSDIDLIPLMVKQVKLQGIAVGHLKALGEMVDAFAAKGVKPIIEKVYGFEEAVAAYTHLIKGSLGKIVIKVS